MTSVESSLSPTACSRHAASCCPCWGPSRALLRQVRRPRRGCFSKSVPGSWSTGSWGLPHLTITATVEPPSAGRRPWVYRAVVLDRFSIGYDCYAHPHRVQSELNGLAQGNGVRGDTSVADKAWFDN